MNHYKQIAEAYGLSSMSTMLDEYTRAKETEAIVDFVGMFPAHSSVLDVGCGNGYTLSVLYEKYPKNVYFGIDDEPELTKLAVSRFRGYDPVSILIGDLNYEFDIQVDILICQRVLINFLPFDQPKILKNIIAMVKPGGHLLFIEGFNRPLSRLNTARAEFGLKPLTSPEYNYYLPDDFFNVPEIEPYIREWSMPSNFLSTHYYVSRVLDPAFKKEFIRNNEFVKFMSDALINIGDYSPLKLYLFTKE